MLKALPCDVVGFEPVAAECEKLNRHRKPGYTYLPHAVGDGQRRTFYECNFPMTSSLFEPNSALLAQFQNLEEFARVVRSYPVDTVRLDDVPEARNADLLKIDVQGAELMIIDNAKETLRTAGVVETEISYVPIYKNQPLFSDIDIAMRERGFLLHRSVHSGRTFKPLIYNNDVNACMSQALWGDAVYARDFTKLDALPPAMLLKMAAIRELFFVRSRVGHFASPRPDDRFGLAAVVPATLRGLGPTGRAGRLRHI